MLSLVRLTKASMVPVKSLYSMLLRSRRTHRLLENLCNLCCVQPHLDAQVCELFELAEDLEATSELVFTHHPELGSCTHVSHQF